MTEIKTSFLGEKILYSCYPHLNRFGGVWITGTIEKLDGVLIIRTCPEDMEGESLKGFCDYLNLEDCPYWYLYKEEILIQNPEPYDSRANGPVFCAVCDDVEIDDEFVTLGISTCHDCEVMR